MDIDKEKYDKIMTPGRLRGLSLYVSYLTFMALVKVILILMYSLPEKEAHFISTTKGYTMDSVFVDIKWKAYYTHRISWNQVDIDTMNSGLKEMVDKELKFFLSKTPYNMFIVMKKNEMIMDKSNAKLILFPKD